MTDRTHNGHTWRDMPGYGAFFTSKTVVWWEDHLSPCPPASGE